MDSAYFQLRLFCQQQGTSFLLKDLADMWDISTKQTKRRLQHYQARNMLTFTPGVGRGHLSQVTFPEPLLDKLQATVSALLAQENLTDLATLLQLPWPNAWLKPFYQQFQSHFGLKKAADEKIILRQITTRPVTSLDPLKVSIYREVNLLYQIGDCLTKLVADQLTPGLAHHWHYDEQELTWHFYLRKGVLFHHGKYLTSSDVRYTIERALSASKFVPWQLLNLQKIVTDGDYHVAFVMKQPEPLLPFYLANVLFIILPSDRPFQENAWLGTGAFYVKEWQPKQFTLRAFDEYYGLRPLIDEVEHVLVNLPPAPTTPQLYLEAGYQEKAALGMGVQFISANLKRNTVIQEFYVREALYYACDVTAYPQQKDQPASHYQEADSLTLKKSLAQGAAALAKGNYHGETLKLGVLHYLAESVSFGEWLQERCQAIGLKIQLVYFSFEEHFYSDFLEKNVDLVLLEDLPVPGEIFPYLAFVASPELLVQRFLPADSKKYLQQAITAYQNAPQLERQKNYLAMDDWLTQNYYLIYTVHSKRRRYVHPMLAGLTSSAQDAFDYRLAWPEESKKDDVC